MASFLSRVGKSGALKEAATFLDTGRKEDLAADVTRTKLGFLQKADLRAEETERRAEQKFENDQALVERENTRRGIKRNVKLSPMFLGLSPAGQKSALADLTSQGIIDENGVAEQGALEDFVKGVESNSKLFKRYMGPEVAQIEQSVIAITSQIQEEQEKDTPNPKKIEALQQKQKGAIEQATLSRGNYEGHLNRLNALEKAKLTASTKGRIKSASDARTRVSAIGKDIDKLLSGDKTFIQAWMKQQGIDLQGVGTEQAEAATEQAVANLRNEKQALIDQWDLKGTSTSDDPLGLGL